MRSEASFVPWLGRVNPWIIDAVLAVAVFAVACLFGSGFNPAGYRPFDALAFLLSALVCLTLVLRRHTPVTVLVISSGAYAAYLATGYHPTINLWGPVLALYTVVALRAPRVAAAGAVIVAGAVFYSGLSEHSLTVVLAAVQAVVVTAVAWALGTATRRLAERNLQLAAATTELRRKQRERTERAVTEERLRIARELHDVVAHHMSVISVQVGLAGYVFDSDRPTARTALDTIAGTTREALDEMRRLLMLLRVSSDTGDHSGDPAPELAGLDALVVRVREAGVPIRLTIAGHPRRLPSGVELCAYRVIQEALTNVLKHAAGHPAQVLVRYGADELMVRISNDGPAPQTDASGPGMIDTPGHGLIGMRERARLYEGSLTAGPGQHGGFEVELVLPMPG